MFSVYSIDHKLTIHPVGTAATYTEAQGLAREASQGKRATFITDEDKPSALRDGMKKKQKGGVVQ